MLQQRIGDDDIADPHPAPHATGNAGKHHRVDIERVNQGAHGGRGRDLADPRKRYDARRAVYRTDVIIALAVSHSAHAGFRAHRLDEVAEFLRQRRHHAERTARDSSVGKRIRMEHLLADAETRFRRALRVRKSRQRRGCRRTRVTLLTVRAREPVAAVTGIVRTTAPARARLDLRRKPLQRFLRQFVEETRTDVVARLAVQHPALRKRQIQALLRPRDRDVHQAALLFEPVRFHRAVLVRKEAFFQPRDEHGREFQTFRRVHRHQLDGFLACLRLVVAGFERCVGQEAGERRHRVGVLRRVGGRGGVEHDRVRIVGGGYQLRRGGRARTQRNRARGRVETVAFLADERCRRVDQFLQVLQPVLAFALVLIELAETAGAHHVFDRFRQAHLLRFRAHLRDQVRKAAKARTSLAGDVRNRGGHRHVIKPR